MDLRNVKVVRMNSLCTVLSPHKPYLVTSRLVKK